MRSRPICTVENLIVTYEGMNTRALENISLTIRANKRLAIIGESGSGKSTLAKTLARLLPKGAKVLGDVIWNMQSEGGSDASPPKPGRDIAYVFQDPGASLNPVLTIGEQVAESAVHHLGMSWAEGFAHARIMLDQVELPASATLLNVYPHQLSGGQRQRVAIAATLSAGPNILIADEATSALDTITQAAIVRLLDRLVQTNGMTLIFITHDIALASSLADDIAVLKSGRLQEGGPAASILSNPQTPYTRQLVEAHLDLSTPPLIGSM